jgi:hypothetical protein
MGSARYGHSEVSGQGAMSNLLKRETPVGLARRAWR